MDEVADPTNMAALIRSVLVEAADASRAPAQQAYMKTEEPYLGVRVPDVRRLVGAQVRSGPVLSRVGWDQLVRALFDNATHREYRYAAIGVLRHRRYLAYRDAAALPLIRHLVITGRWWDLVDDIAHALGDALRADRAVVRDVIVDWAHDDDIWVRRVAVLSQLGHRASVDLNLLSACVDAQLGREEFWLRKASGWALRDASYHHPAWVLEYVDTHSVSPMTRRESLKALTRRADLLT